MIFPKSYFQKQKIRYYIIFHLIIISYLFYLLYYIFLYGKRYNLFELNKFLFIKNIRYVKLT